VGIESIKVRPDDFNLYLLPNDFRSEPLKKLLPIWLGDMPNHAFQSAVI
jgi:hypothetical protein